MELDIHTGLKTTYEKQITELKEQLSTYRTGSVLAQSQMEGLKKKIEKLERKLSEKDNKVYTYIVSWGKEYPDHIRWQWEIIKPTLARQGYRTEVEKIKAGIFASKVYYRYIKEQ